VTRDTFSRIEIDAATRIAFTRQRWDREHASQVIHGDVCHSYNADTSFTLNFQPPTPKAIG
jgi:hypothetical protein